MTIHVTGRMGITPAQRGSTSGATCPDVFRLSDGSYAVIGKIPTAPHLLDDLFTHGASIGDDECLVIVPADCMDPAARDIVQQTSAP